jgi:hypothetical protein
MEFYWESLIEKSVQRTGMGIFFPKTVKGLNGTFLFEQMIPQTIDWIQIESSSKNI